MVRKHLQTKRHNAAELHAEEEAGEAMGRLTRAFVLLCLLRLVIAQRQRRRLLLERQPGWDRPNAWDRPALNV